jgi:hypothetical protein
MTPSLQYRDPLMGILDYIAEVRLHVYASLPSYLVSSKRNALMAPWPLPMMTIYGL